jgi:hypothetical protein
MCFYLEVPKHFTAQCFLPGRNKRPRCALDARKQLLVLALSLDIGHDLGPNKYMA